MRSPYTVIKRRLLTEKSVRLEQGATDRQAERNRSLVKKAVFLVDRHANKTEIAWSLNRLLAEEGLTVRAVHTINVKPKAVRTRGRRGVRPGYKKAIVTFADGKGLEPIAQSMGG